MLKFIYPEFIGRVEESSFNHCEVFQRGWNVVKFCEQKLTILYIYAVFLWMGLNKRLNPTFNQKFD